METKPKKRSLTRSLLKAGAIFFATVTAWSSFYTIDQTKQAVLTQFGKPVKLILNPIDREISGSERLKEKYQKEGIVVSEGAGLRVKIPFIQKVRTFDRRLLRWNGFPEQVPTKDKKYIWVDTTARWYVEDPLQFLRTVGTEIQAQSRLDDIIDAVTRNAITKRDLIEIVRTDNREMEIAEEELRGTLNVGKVSEGRPQIMKEITDASRESCKDYGIGIYPGGVLLKGLNYVESVKEKVEARMIAERERIAEKNISEGEGRYLEIMGDKEKIIREIRSQAYKEAKGIEGQADADAARIYAEGFGRNPEFYSFLRRLDLYKDSLAGEDTKLIIGTDNPLLGTLKGESNTLKKEK